MCGAAAAAFSSGRSVTSASVVSSRPATDAAFFSAERSTFVGSMIPACSMPTNPILQAGIIDPTKVERSALQNAASVAGLLLTTEALVTDLPEEKAAAAAPHMPHGDF